MNHALATVLSTSLVASLASAQGFDLLYSTSANEQTATGSGGTVLRNIYRNEIVGLQMWAGCPARAEKLVSRAAFHTMAGDADGDDNYWEPGMFSQVDALLVTDPYAAGGVNARSTYFSPRTPLATTISGGPGLRPGDVGRIVRNAAGDGQVERFIRAEHIQIALGLPPMPVVVDVDAVAWSPNYGLFFSLDQDIACTLCGAAVTVRDGDIIGIAPGDYMMTGGRITAVAAGMALVVYNEPAIDAFVVNARVADRNAVCVNVAQDLESLELDPTDPMKTVMTSCSGAVLTVPRLLFTTQTLTGGAVLSTSGGGVIHNAMCGPLGVNCGMGPTTGVQIGLQQPTPNVGIQSFVDALAVTYQPLFEFVAEAQTPQIPVGTAAVIDFATPAVANIWVFLTFAPGGPSAIAPSAPFVWGALGHPDFYPAPYFMGVRPTVGGYSNYTSPAIPWPADLVFQGITISGGVIEASAPTMVEVF